VDWQRHPHNLTRRVPDGWLVLASSAQTPVLLSGSAADLWDALDEPAPLARIVATVSHTYRGDPERIRSDVEGALAQLLDLGIVEAVAP
jgi:hypothetical protein